MKPRGGRNLGFTQRTGVRFVIGSAPVATVVACCLIVGVLSLVHPFARWFGIQDWAQIPPVFGVGLLVVPVGFVVLIAWRAWWAIRLKRESLRQRQRRRTR